MFWFRWNTLSGSVAGTAGRAFREFALGFNPLLAVPEREPWIPYYGYGAGVVRLSLGDNSELGGAVTAGVRPLELLYRSHGDRRIDDVGARRPHRVISAPGPSSH